MERIYYVLILHWPLKNFFCHVSAWMYSRCWDLTLTPCRVLIPWKGLHRHRTRWCFYPSYPPQSHSCFKPSAGIWDQSNQPVSSFLLLSTLCHSCLHIFLCLLQNIELKQWKDSKRRPTTSASRCRQLTTLFTESVTKLPKTSVCLNSQHLSPASADTGSALFSGFQQVQMTHCIQYCSLIMLSWLWNAIVVLVTL